MKLLVHELKTELSQLITVGAESIKVVAIRPHLYRHNTAGGSLRVQIEDASGNVIALSETIAISAMPAAQAYWHGYLRFYIKAHLRAGATYRISLVPLSGYSFNESAYIGWCNDYDLRKVPALYTPNAGGAAALDFELWTLQNINPGGS